MVQFPGFQVQEAIPDPTRAPLPWTNHLFLKHIIACFYADRRGSRYKFNVSRREGKKKKKKLFSDWNSLSNGKKKIILGKIPQQRVEFRQVCIILLAKQYQVGGSSPFMFLFLCLDFIHSFPNAGFVLGLNHFLFASRTLQLFLHWGLEFVFVPIGS